VAHTFTHLLTHIVFSTKDREPTITPALRSRLFPYLGGIICELKGHPYIINGPEDHVHILATLSPTIAISDFMSKLKSGASKWVHEDLRNERFAWQTGYGAFSVSKSNTDEVYQYIANQEEHHRKTSFQDEFVALLKRHEIDYDPKYIWE
jgi:putative transposase